MAFTRWAGDLGYFCSSITPRLLDVPLHSFDSDLSSFTQVNVSFFYGRGFFIVKNSTWPVGEPCLVPKGGGMGYKRFKALQPFSLCKKHVVGYEPPWTVGLFNQIKIYVKGATGYLAT